MGCCFFQGNRVSDAKNLQHLRGEAKLMYVLIHFWDYYLDSVLGRDVSEQQACCRVRLSPAGLNRGTKVLALSALIRKVHLTDT